MLVARITAEKANELSGQEYHQELNLAPFKMVTAIGSFH